MKLLVKVVEAKYSDTPQIVVLDTTSEFFTTIRKLMSKAPVKLKMENGISEYFYVDREDLPALVKATEGRVSDWTSSPISGSMTNPGPATGKRSKFMTLTSSSTTQASTSKRLMRRASAISPPRWLSLTLPQKDQC